MERQKTTRIHQTKNNVFLDLDLKEASELQARSSLIFKIGQIIKKRGLTQLEAAKIMGIDQPKISNLMRGRLAGFSTERLFKFLNALGQDVEIVIKPKRNSKSVAEVRVLEDCLSS